VILRPVAFFPDALGDSPDDSSLFFLDFLPSVRVAMIHMSLCAASVVAVPFLGRLRVPAALIHFRLSLPKTDAHSRPPTTPKFPFFPSTSKHATPTPLSLPSIYFLPRSEPTLPRLHPFRRRQRGTAAKVVSASFLISPFPVEQDDSAHRRARSVSLFSGLRRGAVHTWRR